MASLEQQIRGGNFRIVFWFGGRKFGQTLKTGNRQEAEAIVHRVEKNIRLVERGRLEIPADVDVAIFLLSDGKLDKRLILKTTLTLGDLLTSYRKQLPHDSIEKNTLCTIDIHRKHLERILTPTLIVSSMTQVHLQQYVDARSREKGRRKQRVSPVTIKKELATLRGIWNWGRRNGDIVSELPLRDLKYPKTTEKPAFQTLAKIQAQIARGGLSETEQDALWDTLFLTVPELKEVLEHVRLNSPHEYLYPMLFFAAQTGARRSEMLRGRLTDVDLVTGIVVLHEKKRVRGQRTTRRVPLSGTNRTVLEQWLKRHPGGPRLFCRSPIIGETTPQQLRNGQAHYDLKAVLSGTQWECLRGFHVFRHSFASNCAA